MSFIEFTPKESVKIKILDEQHEDYIHVVNQIYDNILPGDKTAIINLLNKLIELLEIHFDTEEKLMKEYHDPGYISHKLEHDRYYNQIIDMTDKYRKGEVNLSMEQLEGFKKWFYNHLDFNDRKCGEFLFSKGVK